MRNNNEEKIIIILFCIIILICIGIRSPNMENVENDTYIGEYSCSPIHVKVEVTIKHQSLDADTISGATVSNNCILKAVENAIEREND